MDTIINKSKRQVKRELLAQAINSVTTLLKDAITSVHVASTGSCYIKVNTRDGVKKIRIADHQCHATSRNDLEVRVDITKRRGEVFPSCKVENAISRLNAKFGRVTL